MVLADRWECLNLCDIYLPRDDDLGLSTSGYLRSVSLKKDILKQWFDKGNIVQFDPGKPGLSLTSHPDLPSVCVEFGITCRYVSQVSSFYLS